MTRAFYYDSIDSTNEQAKRLLTCGDIKDATFDAPAYVLANAQTAGKGTRGRVWVSPEGAGLYLTIVHTQAARRPLQVTHHYTQAAGLACLEVLRDLFGVSLKLKPINDLYARCPQEGRYKKLGGILVEAVIQEGGLQAIMTGIGINLLAVERQLPMITGQAHPEIVPISLEELVDRPKIIHMQAAVAGFSEWRPNPVRLELTEAIVSTVGERYQAIQDAVPNLAALEADYAAHCID